MAWEQTFKSVCESKVIFIICPLWRGFCALLQILLDELKCAFYARTNSSTQSPCLVKSSNLRLKFALSKYLRNYNQVE